MPSNEYSPQTILDTTGLMCPEPVMLLHKAIRQAGGGDYIKVIATDPSTQRDIPKFCEFLGHQLICESLEGASFLYLIRKKAKG